MRLKAVQVISNPEVVGLLIDPIRRTILTMLGSKEMTERQMARLLGFKSSSVAHHLRVLEKARLISISRKEPENHGIIQKFYRSNALTFTIDTRKVPASTSRYFYPLNIERIRCFLCVYDSLHLKNVDISVETLETLAKEYADRLAEAAEKYSDMDAESFNREEIVAKIYNQAFTSLLKENGMPRSAKKRVMKKIVGKSNCA